MIIIHFETVISLPKHLLKIVILKTLSLHWGMHTEFWRGELLGKFYVEDQEGDVRVPLIWRVVRIRGERHCHRINGGLSH
jgi:hypothetical protein